MKMEDKILMMKKWLPYLEMGIDRLTTGGALS